MAKARKRVPQPSDSAAPSNKGKKPARHTETAEELLEQLTEQDRELVRLLNERARTLVKIAKCRKRAGQATLVFSEEAERISRAAATGRGPLPRDAIQAALREVVSGCRSLVRDLRVAFLGPLYTYSHLATIAHFGQSVEMAPVGSIAAVFEEVNRGQADFGLVPIENSTDGRIADTLDMFTRLPVRICGEVELEIQHFLLGKCARSEIREVYSKQQPLSQCRNWLARHLPSARAIEVTSTATAAQLALEKPGAAAIASLQAGMHYGLNVIAERIEDNRNNTTRFAVIGDHTAVATGNDRTALLVQTEHRFGALADVLGIFKKNRLNLTWIESFPVPDSPRTYLFFVEVEGHQTEQAVVKCLKTLEGTTLRLEILGSFPAAVRT
ncbi:MAG: prephenate dehydratase [Planctomycetaceae bacterium]|nr:prephenate dehydratase [Planctomycetaceae bacterium]